MYYVYVPQGLCCWPLIAGYQWVDVDTIIHYVHFSTLPSVDMTDDQSDQACFYLGTQSRNGQMSDEPELRLPAPGFLLNVLRVGWDG